MMALETLPIREKEKFLAEEEKARRLELRAIKENIWKKWRNRREGTVHKSGEEKDFEKSEMEKTLEKLERIIERIKSEEIERGERQERDRERKRVWRKEKEKEESKMLVREVERVERREKKKELEDRWSLMKWLAKFIEENEGNWKREELIKGKKLSVEEWETLTEKGKKEEIVRFETQKEKSLRKSNSWREWRPPATLPTKENPGDTALSNLNLSSDEREDLQDLEIPIKTVVKRPKILPPPATSEIPP